MKKLSPIAYRSLFFKHTWRFIGNVMRPYELKTHHMLAVSGGMDSMALLWVAKILYSQGKIGPVRAVYIHHQTRTGQDEEGEMVRKFCEQEGIPFKILRVEGLQAKSADFENLARKKRRELFYGELKKNELLWQGHHLDDSHEWSLMQKFRSNHLKTSLGIPVRNGPIVRPFLCVTRAQIKRMVKFEGIPYKDDPTNFDLKHDRNYIRHKVIPPIRKRYPSYLKHYSHFSNFEALLLKVSLFAATAAEIYAYEEGALLIGSHFTEIQIQEIIHTYSNTDRGEIVGPIQAMLKAIDNGKKGPFHFSGGMEAYYTANLLMIYRQGLENYDENIAATLSHLTEKQLNAMPHYKLTELEHSWQHLIKKSDAMLNMPGPVLILESDSLCKTLNASVFDPLFPRISEVCKARGLRFVAFQKCLHTWRRKKEKLPEKLRLLPLYNLSNLFSSQQ
jgi:tRNA(Ile)-lysidine synthase